MIELYNITKSYPGKKNVIHELNLKIPNGSYVSIVGESGSGKTTLLNILGLLDSFDMGEYRLNGKNITKYKSHQLSDIRNKEIGFVFQSYNLISKMSVLDNVKLPYLYNSKGFKKRNDDYIEGLLDRFNILDIKNKNVDDLSGGEKQRVSFVRALTMKANIIIADEPTGNLDPGNTDIILDIFDELHKENKTIIVVTHDYSVAKRAKTKYQLLNGKLVKYD